MMAADGPITPLTTSQFIADNAVDVKICADSVPSVAEKILEQLVTEEFNLGDWKKGGLCPKVADLAAIDWIFLVDSLNFCFWTNETDPAFCVTYNGTAHTGTFGMYACVQRALDEGMALTKPEYFQSVTRESLQHAFRSDNGSEIPLLDERLKVLHENGTVLLEKFGGSFANCLKLCKCNAQVLLKIIVDNFPSFKDEGTYLNQNVLFYKRAQIMVADIWACFEGKDLGLFHDIDSITMFADYRVPQVLLHFGLLKYSDNLFAKLENKELLVNGGREEMEIRGCSIVATELLVRELRKMAPAVTRPPAIINNIVVDFHLWGHRRRHAAALDQVPFHRAKRVQGDQKLQRVGKRKKQKKSSLMSINDQK